MNQYKDINKNLVALILLIIIASALIIWVFSIAGKINPLIIPDSISFQYFFHYRQLYMNIIK